MERSPRKTAKPKKVGDTEERRSADSMLPNENKLAPLKRPVSAATLQRLVKLNVGGTKFETAIGVLRGDMLQQQSQDNILFKIAQGDSLYLKDADGFYFIDRNPMVFDAVLEYLRSGSLMRMKELGLSQTALVSELDYFQIKHGFAVVESEDGTSFKDALRMQFEKFEKLAQLFVEANVEYFTSIILDVISHGYLEFEVDCWDSNSETPFNPNLFVKEVCKPPHQPIYNKAIEKAISRLLGVDVRLIFGNSKTKILILYE